MIPTIPKGAVDRLRAAYPIHNQGVPVFNTSTSYIFPGSQGPLAPVPAHWGITPIVLLSNNSSNNNTLSPSPPTLASQNQVATAAAGLLALSHPIMYQLRVGRIATRLSFSVRSRYLNTSRPHTLRRRNKLEVSARRRPSGFGMPLNPVVPAQTNQPVLPPAPIPAPAVLAAPLPLPLWPNQQGIRFHGIVILNNIPKSITLYGASDCLDPDELMRQMRVNVADLEEKYKIMKEILVGDPDYEEKLREWKEKIDKQCDEIWSRLYQRHDLIEDAWSGHRNNQFDTPEVKEALIRHHHRIHTLHVRTFKSRIFSVIADLSGLSGLTTLSIRDYLTTDQQFDQLLAVLEKSPNLRSLYVERPPPTEWLEPLLKSIARALPRLQELELFIEGQPIVSPRVAREFFETCSSELVAMTLGLMFYSDDFDEEEYESLILPVEGSQTHPKLKYFSLRSHVQSGESRIIPAVLSTFLRGCNSLEVVDDALTFKTSSLSWIHAHPEILDALQEAMGVHLLALVMMSSEDILELENFVSQEIGNFGGQRRDDGVQQVWHTIFLMTCPPPGSASLRALVDASRKGLQKLVICDTDYVVGSELHSVLHQGRSLVMLDFDDFPTINTSDLLSSTWSSRWLTALKIRIAGIPRPDVQRDYKNRPIPEGTPLHSGTVEESRWIQQRVYSQLGSLTNLRVLELGTIDHRGNLVREKDKKGDYVMFDPMLQVTSLEMTLESGLDLLSGLSRLRELNVGTMDHRIGKKELFWMQRHWPYLTDVRGLVRTYVEVDGWSGVTTNIISLPFGRVSGSDPEVLNCKLSFFVE
ncbi:hypothetical protein BGZ88_012465 [Linnemannia elongata]|nr:hypothetical protein BGZ88_012465 [Linnemannia elongata]